MKLLDRLEENSDFEIKDVIEDYDLKRKCVIIAGLCHDIGHGPFSHLWDQIVHKYDETWTHEEQSEKMIKFMIKENNIKFHVDDVKHEFAVELISSLIKGDSIKWSEILKPEEIFLTEVVSNKHCEIDVDKCDYILRDHKHLNNNSIEFKDFVKFLERSKVVFDENKISHIGYHKDDFQLIENLFYNRAYFHEHVYQCNEVLACDRMVLDALNEATSGKFLFKNLQLSEVHKNDEAYLELDDSILDKIYESPIKNENMIKAKEIIVNLRTKKFYKNVLKSPNKNRKILEDLKPKFKGNLHEVEMEIPKANVPNNIPLYSDASKALVEKISDLQLAKQSWLVYVDNEKYEEAQKVIETITNTNA
jgi:deoxynucleoside triphosphate triphosphohydrolase SAMHD1